MTTRTRVPGAVTRSTSSSMNRVAVSSSTCVNSSSNWSMTTSSWSWSVGRTRSTARRTPPGVSTRSSSVVGGSDAMRSSAASSSSNGCGAGVMSIRNQSADIGSAPFANAGSSPARTTLDLPLPLGPTTATKRPRMPGAPRRAMSRSTSRSRPKNSPASAGPNARSPLYGFSISVSSSNGDRGDAERVGQRLPERRHVRVPPCRIGGGGPVEHRRARLVPVRPEPARTRRPCR